MASLPSQLEFLCLNHKMQEKVKKKTPQVQEEIDDGIK